MTIKEAQKISRVMELWQKNGYKFVYQNLMMGGEYVELIVIEKICLKSKCVYFYWETNFNSKTHKNDLESRSLRQIKYKDIFVIYPVFKKIDELERIDKIVLGFSKAKTISDLEWKNDN